MWCLALVALAGLASAKLTAHWESYQPKYAAFQSGGTQGKIQAAVSWTNLPPGFRGVTFLKGAPRLDIEPMQQTLREGSEAVFTCRALDPPYPTVIWSRMGGALPSNARDDGRGRLTISGLRVGDSGQYVCIGHGDKGASNELQATLVVNPSAVAEQRGGGGRCLADEKSCRNGECVKLAYVCDGEYDCRDRSDEEGCPPPKPCEPNEFQCDNRRCVQKMWLCDGDDDCGDGSDERDCGTKAPGETCGPREFKCAGRDQCVPAAFQCDGQNDCFDGSDEVGCVPPNVVQPPPPRKDVNPGETIVIECRAVGMPTPYINWRLNWGKVCGEPRCTQTSVNGVGTLTIRNAVGTDSGAYTCEAINIKGRVLAVPDCIVTVREASRCNPAGSASPQPDARGQCQCKANVEGPLCDRCKPGSYFLNAANPNGCIRCFGMGVQQGCSSANWWRTQSRHSFGPGSVRPGDSILVDVTETRPLVNPAINFNTPGMITNTDQHPGYTLYWKLPQSMCGDKVTAYGGNLRFSFKFTGGDRQWNRDGMVVLKGNDITIYHRVDPRKEYGPDAVHTIEIAMYENNWERENGQPVTREHFLMVLADLESFLIRATHNGGATSTSLGEVTIDIASQQPTGGERAWAVEDCRCPQGYIGLSCQDCAPGYERSGGGLYLGTCVPVRQAECSGAGAVSPYPDPRTGRCECKPYTRGQLCDQCIDHSYFLAPQNPYGCIKCFCSGVTKQCSSSRLYRTQQRLSFQGGSAPTVNVRSFEPVNPLRPRAEASVNAERNLEFTSFGEAGGRALYWEMPQMFLDDKVTAYGGALKFRVKFEGGGGPDGSAHVVLRGNDITLLYRHDRELSPGRENMVEVQFYEDRWEREDGQPATREHLLMTLSDLEELLIKLSFTTSATSSSLIEVIMDYAVDTDTQQEQAFAVEQCVCPPGYKGTSCEDCDAGYARSGGGLYLGLCEKCQCYGHADECDLEYGFCINCQHNTEGDNCERCKAGYEGDATRGTPYDCRPVAAPAPCNCHNHSPRGCDSASRCLFCEHNTEGNNCERCKAGYYGDARAGTPFDCTPCPCPGARECYLDAQGQVVCRSCPAGYTGRLCDACAPGYTQDPSDPSQCRSIERSPPRVRIEPTNEWRADIGNSFEFRGIGEGVPDVRLSWAREDGQPLGPRVIDLGDGRLQLNNAEKEDEGAYILTGRNELGEDTDTAYVRLGPALLVRITPDVQEHRIPEGSPLRLECDVTGSGDVSQEWIRDRPPERGDNPDNYSPEVIDGATVTHPAVTKYNEGDYTCRGSNGQMSKDRKIRVIVIPAAQRPVLILGPSEAEYKAGDRVELRCTAPGPLAESLSWKRVGDDGEAGSQPLPDDAEEPETGVLVLPAFSEEVAGAYECQGFDEAGGPPVSTARVNVVAAPASDNRLVIDGPVTRVLQEGDTLNLLCDAPGRPDIEPYWTFSRYGGTSLPIPEYDMTRRVNLPGLFIQDGGVYTCVLQAGLDDPILNTSNVTVIVAAKSEQEGGYPVTQEGSSGSDVSLICPIYSVPGVGLEWSREEGDLPDKSRANEDNELLIPDFGVDDEGIYSCKADVGGELAFGYVQAVLQEAEEVIQVFMKTSSNSIEIGDTVTFTCIVEGDENAELTWEKQGGELPVTADIAENTLTLSDIQDEDGGIYRCTAATRVGPLSADAALNIGKGQTKGGGGGGVGTVVLGGQTSVVPVGTDARLVCPASAKDGVPAKIHWSREGQPLLGRFRVTSGVLQISDVARADEGVYSCTVTTDTQQKVRVEVHLHVSDLIPALEGDGYVELGPLPPSASDELSLSLSFKPFSQDGLLYYAPANEGSGEGSGDETGESGDMVSIALKDGKVHYRLAMGDGLTELVSEHPVALGEWHRVSVKRSGDSAHLSVNDEDEQTATVEGDAAQLSLGDSVFLGGAPNLPSKDTKRIGAEKGLTGYISQYEVEDRPVDIGEAELSLEKATPAPVCATRPCENSGRCRAAHELEGYRCDCDSGWAGAHCERPGRSCNEGLCDAGTCVEGADGGFSCLCPLNRTGETCAESADLSGASPSFDGQSSFLSIPRPDPVRRSFQIALRIRPEQLTDGIVFYAADSSKGEGDFIGLAVKDQALELSFDSGSGPTNLRSEVGLTQGEWVKVSVEREGREASLTVNGEKTTGEAPEGMEDLNLDENFFIGGVWPGVMVAPGIGVSAPLNGCITSPVSLNGEEVDLTEAAVESGGVSACAATDACASFPCAMGGTCKASEDGEDYECLCPEGVSDCTKEGAVCQEDSCDHGQCRESEGAAVCDCEVSYAGERCEEFRPVEKQGSFSGASWVELDKELMPHVTSEKEEIISLKFRTEEDEGLLLWHGQPPGTPGSDQDYLSLGVMDGFLEFAFELGGGPAAMTSAFKVNDGNIHSVKLIRKGREGSLLVDDAEPVTGRSGGILAMLNTEGSIYVGGVPELEVMTGGKHAANFKGCIAELELEGQKVDFLEMSIGGQNVLPCEFELRRRRRWTRLLLP